MKHVFGNIGLVTVLAFMFAIPFTSVGIIKYTEPEYKSKAAVLGTKIIRESVEVVDQIEYDITFGDTTIQRLYNVIPQDYLGDEYQVVVSVPNEAKDFGVRSDLIKEDEYADLVVTTPFDFDNTEYPEMRLILIVLK